MELHIQVHELLNALFFNGFLIAELLIGNEKLTELGSPVAQMIDTDNLIAQLAEDLVKGISNDRGTEMADMEILGNIGRGIVDTNRFPLADLTTSEFGNTPVSIQKSGRVLGLIDIEVQIGAYGADLREIGRMTDLI